MDTNELLELILREQRITNHLLATVLIEHHKPLEKQGYAHDEPSLKEWEIMAKLKASAEVIDNS